MCLGSIWNELILLEAYLNPLSCDSKSRKQVMRLIQPQECSKAFLNYQSKRVSFLLDRLNTLASFDSFVKNQPQQKIQLLKK